MEIEREQKYSDTFSSPGCAGQPAGPSVPAVATAHCRGGGTIWNVEVKSKTVNFFAKI